VQPAIDTPGNPVFFAGTFNGHPAVAAAALATIAKLERAPVHEHLFALGDRIRRAERDLAAATARTGMATADLYPRFSLTGSFSHSANCGKSSNSSSVL